MSLNFMSVCNVKFRTTIAIMTIAFKVAYFSPIKNVLYITIILKWSCDINIYLYNLSDLRWKLWSYIYGV